MLRFTQHDGYAARRWIRHSLVREPAVFVFFLLLSILNTWPLVLNLDSALSDPGDPYFNSWILHWDWWATFHRPLSLFHAPIFHPARYTLAFSENLYGIALILFPFYAFGAEPITAYNIAMLLGFALNGYGAFVLARMATGSSIAALAGGIFFAFVPYRFTHLSHIQHVWAGWLPLLLAALIHHLRRPSWRRAALFAAAFLINGLSNIHWLLFGSVALLLSIIFLLLTDARVREQRFWRPLLTTTMIAALLLLPFLLPYRSASRLYGMKRSRGESLGGSAKAQDWFISAPPNKIYGDLANVERGVPERWLFPGVLSLLLAASALLLCRKEDFPESVAPPSGPQFEAGTAALRPRIRDRVARVDTGRVQLLDGFIVVAAVLGYYQWASDKSWPVNFLMVSFGLLILRLAIRFPAAWGGRAQSLLSWGARIAQAMRPRPERWRFPDGVRLAILWVIVGFLGSRGLRLFFYEFLFDHVQMFRSIRIPARFAMVAYVGLSVLIAAGILPLMRRARRAGRVLVGAAVAALFLAELRAAPIRWYLALPEPPPVYRWLATAPISGAVVELPFGWDEIEYMLWTTAHHRPLINGFSGFFTITHEQLSRMSNAEAIPPAFADYLERLRCSLVIVHNEKMNTRPAVLKWLESQLARGRLVFVRRFEHGAGGDYVFALSRTEPRAAERLRLPERPDASSFTPLQKAQQFLAGNHHVYNGSTFGWIDSPPDGTDERGNLRVSGWALSPHGIARVNLRFENGRVVVPADLFSWEALHRKYPWYPRADRPGFIKEFTVPPPGVRGETDLQVEIFDGAGSRTRLEPVWFRWSPGAM